jgi:hypothetical protein
MADSPYATLAGVLQADVANLQRARVDHTTRHGGAFGCPATGGCEVRKVLDGALEKISEMLEREMASSSPAPRRSMTFRPLTPELKAKLAQSGGTGLT